MIFLDLLDLRLGEGKGNFKYDTRRLNRSERPDGCPPPLVPLENPRVTRYSVRSE